MSHTSNLRDISIGALTVALCGCVAYGDPTVNRPHSNPYPPAYPYPPSQPSIIPEGHRPPPGQCRIWFPDLPPGQQSPPGDCYDLERRVPPGAILDRG